MHIKRVEGMQGEIEYQSEDGRIFEEITVTIDGKTIVADVVQVDTTEGWVEIELPELKEVKYIDKQTPIDIKSSVPVFDTIIKRLMGKVKVFSKK
jgi:hypothetical protein